MDKHKPYNLKVITILGETASGKTGLALDLAERLDGEVICADSWTVYKGFDIGTAKPTAEEQARAPHHLLDVADPEVGFSAAIFKRMAEAAIEDIRSRGKTPIIVGGTGLYIDAILYDYSFLPPSDPAMREELNALTIEQLIARAEEMELDTTGIDLRNKRRIIRLIENNGVRPTKNAMREDALVVGMTRPPEVLRERIVARIDAMVEAGFPDEVRKLGEQYGWDCEPMRAPGYRAFSEYVQGKITLEMAKERFRQNDLQLAKKQRTWFKRNPNIHWFDDPAKAFEFVMAQV